MIQINFNRIALKKSLSKLKNCLAVKSINPLLQHFYFNIENKVMTVKATDTYIASIWKTPVDITDSCTFTLPGDTFYNILNSLDDETITLEFTPQDNSLKLSCGNYVWESVSGNPEDFPKFNLPDNLKEISLPEDFAESLNSIYFSIGNDSINAPDLNSLCLDINKDDSKEISLISSDRMRLSHKKIPVDVSDSARFIIPKDSVNEIIKLEPESLLYNYQVNKLFFKIGSENGEIYFSTILINKEYPDLYTYLTTISESFNNLKLVEIDKSALTKVIRRVLLATKNLTSKNGKIKIEPSVLTVSSENTANKVNEYLKIATEVNAEIALNFGFLLEYLSQEVSEKISFKVLPNQCLVFLKEDYTHILSLTREV